MELHLGAPPGAIPPRQPQAHKHDLHGVPSINIDTRVLAAGAAGEHRHPVTRALHVAGTSLFVVQAACAAALLRPLLLLTGVMTAYGLAWVGHFFVVRPCGGLPACSPLPGSAAASAPRAWLFAPHQPPLWPSPRRRTTGQPHSSERAVEEREHAGGLEQQSACQELHTCRACGASPGARHRPSATPPPPCHACPPGTRASRCGQTL